MSYEGVHSSRVITQLLVVIAILRILLQFLCHRHFTYFTTISFFPLQLNGFNPNLSQEAQGRCRWIHVELHTPDTATHAIGARQAQETLHSTLREARPLPT